MGETRGKERRPWLCGSHGSPLERVASVGKCPGGTDAGVAAAGPSCAGSMAVGKLPEIRVISDERQTERGK